MQPISDPFAEMSSGYFLVSKPNFSTSLACDPLPMQACIPGDLVNFVHLMPHLLEIRALNPRQLEELKHLLRMQTEGKQAPSVCAWLLSSLDIEKLADQIARFLCVNDGNGAPVFWRYFDPRVFAIAMEAFNQEQRNALLGPISKWNFAWGPYWWSVQGASHEVDRLSDYETAMPDKAQWQILHFSKIISVVLARLSAEQNLSPQDYLQTQKTVIACLLDATTKLQLSDADDLTEFAYLCAKYGPAFRDHSKLKPAWTELAQGRLSWSELRCRLDQTDLQKLQTPTAPYLF
ncbi:DUF4123 domain-containing protein [Oxalobacteraceae bacterium]|nr:DUF4123 domain-containing protein [Oxalobacteraceae bacterium]